MELRNIEQAQKLFPDAVKLQLRINKEMSAKEVRNLLPNSVVLLSCKITKNYANVIYSEGAAKRLFPDITMHQQRVLIGNGQEANVYDCKKGGVKVLVNFLPTSNPIFLDRLEQAFGKNLVSLTSYGDANMGCLFFQNVQLNDVVGVIALCSSEDGKII